jgi:hypothetical protein
VRVFIYNESEELWMVGKKRAVDNQLGGSNLNINQSN